MTASCAASLSRASCWAVVARALLLAAALAGPRLAIAQTALTEPQRAALVQQLARTDALVRQLKTSSDTAAAEAEAMRTRCATQVTDMDRKLGELQQQRSAFDRHGEELFVSLARSFETSRNEDATVAALRKRLEDTRASVDNYQHQLDLLARWWWVPGYGAYLGIKSLVNNEVGQLQSLREELSHSQLQVADHAALLVKSRGVVCESIDGQEKLGTALEALTCMNGVALTRSVELRKRTIALLDREEFWLKLKDLGTITVDNRSRALADALQATPSPRIEAQIAARATQLEQALQLHQQMLAAGQQFLTSVPADYCSHEEPGHGCAPPPDHSLSFERSCKDIAIEGDGTTVSAVCQNGRRSSTRILGVHNNDGTLVQSGVPFNHGREPSTFQKSCNNLFMCGTTLVASCARRNGAWTQNRLKLHGIITMNGQVFMQSNE